MAECDAGEGMEVKPTSVKDAQYIYERRKENMDNNQYPIPEESGKWMMFYHAMVLNQAWARAKHLYRSGQIPDVKGMKVTTALSMEEYKSNTGVVIFYCGPASDRSKMIAIGRDLAQKMDYGKPYISYKTDLMTLQGIKGSIYTIRLR